MIGQSSNRNIYCWFWWVNVVCNKLVEVGRALNNYASSKGVILYHRWKHGVLESDFRGTSSKWFCFKVLWDDWSCWLDTYYLGVQLPVLKSLLKVTYSVALHLSNYPLWFVLWMDSNETRWLLLLYLSLLTTFHICHKFQIPFFWLVDNNLKRDSYSQSFFSRAFNVLLSWTKYSIAIIRLKNKAYKKKFHWNTSSVRKVFTCR